ncbi:tRNA lysidine(34) synthetase TilS [Afipia sp. TerB]
MSNTETLPVLALEAKRLFADFRSMPVLVLAVSGGPDSVALMWLAARWRAALKQGPRLVAVTVDHGLRAESAREARDVKRLATSLGIEHRTLAWRGDKPKTGLPAAARDARYDLLAKAARGVGAVHIVTAHTRDDQAETVLMRLSRGSGIAGLAGMARQSARGDVVLLRPLLDVPKERLVATLKRAKIDFATDPTNRDLVYARPRLRALMPALAAEGADARNLTRLAARLARANAALDLMADGAERYLARLDAHGGRDGFDLAAFSALGDEIRVRLLLRAIDRIGHEGPAELGKVETLVQALDSAIGATKTGRKHARFKQSLAGAIVSIERGRIRIVPAPPRRRGRN